MIEHIRGNENKSHIFRSDIIFLRYQSFLLIIFHFSKLKMKTRCLITSRCTINSNIFLMNEFDIIIMSDWLLVFISPYFLHVWLFSRIRKVFAMSN